MSDIPALVVVRTRYGPVVIPPHIGAVDISYYHKLIGACRQIVNGSHVVREINSLNS